MYGLFENIQKTKEHEMKFLAHVHGVDLKSTKQSEPSAILEDKVPLFGNPEDYEKMSDDEREDLTQKMMGKHKNWVSGGLLKQ